MQRMRDRVLELEGIADTYLFHRRVLGQEPVVITSATANTMPVMIERHTRNNNQINGTGIRLSLRLRNTQTPFTHHVLSVVRANLHRAAMGYR